MSVLKSILNNASDFKDLLAKSGLFDCFKVGTIVVSGQCITDYIKSSNYTGDTFLPSATEGSFLDLKRGRFNFGGGNITFDGTTLNICKGGIVYDGSNLTIQADTLKIGPRNVQDMIDAVEDKADDAAAAAAAAASSANQAAKTATNYLTYSTGGGLIISQTANASSYGYNTQILSDGINFRYNNVVKATIDMNAYKVFDGNGTGINNILAKFGVDGDGNGEMQLGKANEYHTYITNNGIYMKNGTNNLMSITRRDGVADIDTTGMYKINGNPVLTKNGFNSSLADAFMVKQVLVAEDWNIGPNDWAGELFSVEDLLGTTLFNSYNVLGILGYEIDNYKDKGRFSRITVTGMSLYIGASGKQYVDITLRNNSPARGGCHINVYVSLFLVRKEITLVPSVIDNKDSHNTGDDDTEIDT
jgi:hypothetical protein